MTPEGAAFHLRHRVRGESRLGVLRAMADGTGILVAWWDGKRVVKGPDAEILVDLVAAAYIVPDSEVLTAWQKERGAAGYAITAAGREIAGEAAA